MKKLFLLSVIITSFSSLGGFIAENWACKKPDIGYRYFLNKKECENHYKEICYKTPKKYNHQTCSLDFVDIDDLSKPVMSKTEVIECLDEADCDSKFMDFKCEDIESEPIKNIDKLELYCTKILRYKKKKSERKVIVESKEKKIEFLSFKEKLQKKLKESQLEFERITEKVQAGEELSKEEMNKIILNLIKR